MNEDPDLASKRGYVRRMAMFFTACALVCGALVALGLFKAMTADAGYLVMFFVFLLCGTPLFFRARHFLGDLGVEPVVVEGEIIKKWDKSNPLEIPAIVVIVLVPLAAYRVVHTETISLLALVLYAAAAFFLVLRFGAPIIRELTTLRHRKGSPLRVGGAALSMFFLPSFYIAVEQRIFSISDDEYLRLLETDLVRVRHFPHSLTVEYLERYDPVDKQFVPAASDLF